MNKKSYERSGNDLIITSNPSLIFCICVLTPFGKLTENHLYHRVSFLIMFQAAKFCKIHRKKLCTGVSILIKMETEFFSKLTRKHLNRGPVFHKLANFARNSCAGVSF